MVCEQVVLRTQGGSLCREGSYAVKPPAPEGFEATWHESRDRMNRKWTLCRHRCPLAVACTVLWPLGRYIDRKNDTLIHIDVDGQMSMYLEIMQVKRRINGCKLNCCVNMTWQKNGPKGKYLGQMEAFGLSTSLGNSWLWNHFFGLVRGTPWLSGGLALKDEPAQTALYHRRTSSALVQKCLAPL